MLCLRCEISYALPLLIYITYNTSEWISISPLFLKLALFHTDIWLLMPVLQTFVTLWGFVIVLNLVLRQLYSDSPMLCCYRRHSVKATFWASFIVLVVALELTNFLFYFGTSKNSIKCRCFQLLCPASVTYSQSSSIRLCLEFVCSFVTFFGSLFQIFVSKNGKLPYKISGFFFLSLSVSIFRWSGLSRWFFLLFHGFKVSIAQW